MKLIVGLGNPGEKYRLTRHNAGFMALDQLAAKEALAWKLDKKFNAEIAASGNFTLLKPQTFMNESGLSVQAALRFFQNIDPETDLLLVHDDLDIPLGTHKLSFDSRSAGHNGVQSVINQLGTKSFHRLRIGINRPEPETLPIEKYVLQKFSPAELASLNLCLAELPLPDFPMIPKK